MKKYEWTDKEINALMNDAQDAIANDNHYDKEGNILTVEMIHEAIEVLKAYNVNSISDIPTYIEVEIPTEHFDLI